MKGEEFEAQEVKSQSCHAEQPGSKKAQFILLFSIIAPGFIEDLIMKKCLPISIIFLTIALASCQQRMFGVDETTWSTLSEQEREKVIDGYNKRKEIELANQITREEKQLENERHRQEVEAQTAPFYAAAEVVSSICGKSSNESQSSNRIQSVSSKIGKQVVTVRDTDFEISPFSKISDAWIKGQKVQITKNDNDFVYSVKLTNLDNGETVSARKK